MPGIFCKKESSFTGRPGPKADDGPAEFNFTGLVEAIFMSSDAIVPGLVEEVIGQKVNFGIGMYLKQQ